MAQVTRTQGPNLAQQIGKALEGGMQGIKFADDLKSAQANREYMANQAEMLKEQVAMQKQQVKTQSMVGFTDYMGIAGGIEDPKLRKSYLKSNWGVIQNMANSAGIQVTPDNIDMFADFSPMVSNARAQFENFRSILDNNPGSISSGEIASKLGATIKTLPESLQRAYQPLVEELYNQAKQQEQDARAKDLDLKPGQMKGDEVTYVAPKKEKEGLDLKSMKDLESLIKMPTDTRKSIREKDDSIESVSSITNTLDSNPELEKNFIGTKSAAWAKILANPTTKQLTSLFGVNSEDALSPDQRVLMAQTEKLFQTYRKEITGAQAAVKELTQLKPLVPDLLQDPKTFRSGLAFMDLTLKASKAREIGNYLKTLNPEVRGEAASRYLSGLDENTRQMVGEYMKDGSIDSGRFKVLFEETKGEAPPKIKVGSKEFSVGETVIYKGKAYTVTEQGLEEK